MASATAKALERPAVQVATGNFKVASSLNKVQTDREGLYNLTEMVRDFVRSSGIQAGSVTVAGLHTTSAVFISEWQQDALNHDVQAYLSGIVCKDGYYRHNDPAWSDCDRHNAAAHLRTLMLGTSLTLQVAGGDLVLGEFQSIIMAEFDGPRERSVRLQAMGIAGD